MGKKGDSMSIRQEVWSGAKARAFRVRTAALAVGVTVAAGLMAACSTTAVGAPVPAAAVVPVHLDPAQLQQMRAFAASIPGQPQLDAAARKHHAAPKPGFSISGDTLWLSIPIATALAVGVEAACDTMIPEAYWWACPLVSTTVESQLGNLRLLDIQGVQVGLNLDNGDLTARTW